MLRRCPICQYEMPDQNYDEHIAAMHGPSVRAPDADKRVAELERERSDILHILQVKSAIAERNLAKANARIAELEAKVAALKMEKWRAQHTDTMNDLVLLGMAKDDAERALASANARIERMKGVLGWIGDAPSRKIAEHSITTLSNYSPPERIWQAFKETSRMFAEVVTFARAALLESEAPDASKTIFRHPA